MNSATTITIELYGQLKDTFAAQTIEHRLEPGVPTNVQQLYQALRAQQPNAPQQQQIRPIINDTFVEWDAGFQAGDVIGFLPPASGG
ncbi:MoaD/ThiS family protein [Marinicella meishanensis]|uniref:MoaD/ThiS family protein n=1 Tax=Marinicella meishanensis TaxID=2873263 RepID=UPI001CBD833D|nr:MoaD/ThiS family protein [Marinicella sp. NBU2979]